MRIFAALAAFALLGSSTLSAASADYYLHIKGVSRDSAAGPIYLLADIGDLDGDGVAEDALVRLACTGNDLGAVHYNVKSPRDSASGMATGKRTHGPVTFVKEWGPSTPQLSAMRPTYDLKAAKGARMAADADGWTAMTLSDADGLCPAAEAALKAVKTRSNIQNN
jgi:hypothetical protein